jgi:hypothetical protein
VMAQDWEPSRGPVQSSERDDGVHDSVADFVDAVKEAGAALGDVAGERARPDFGPHPAPPPGPGGRRIVVSIEREGGSELPAS